MIGINLIPRNQTIARMKQRRIRRWSIACAAALFVVAMPVGLEWYRKVRANELEARFGELHGERETLRAELAEIGAASREIYLQIERAKALRSKRSWSGMLQLLEMTMPEGCWLIDLATDPASPSGQPSRRSNPVVSAGAIAEKDNATIVIEAPRAVRLAGFATEVTDPLAFVSNLKDTGVFVHVDLERLVRELVGKRYYFRFEIVCTW